MSGEPGCLLQGRQGSMLRVGYCNYRADPRMKRNTGDCQKSNSSTNEVKCSRTHCLGFRFWCTTSRSRCSRSYLHKYRDFFFFLISSPECLTSMVSGVWGRAEKTQSHMPFTDSIHERSGQEGGGLSSKNNNRRPGLGGPAH